MSRRRSHGPAIALALMALSSPALVAQSVAPATALALREATPSLPRPTLLKSAYRIHLRSTWPQLAAGPAGCMNGGEETLDGTLTLGADGSYIGTFERHTQLLFCGAHGPGSGEGCQLTLEGAGRVQVSAVVMSDDTSPSGRSARLLWVPAPDHGATVTGACPARFKQAVETMYLSAVHGVELPLTAAGSGPRTEELQGYAWTVNVE